MAGVGVGTGVLSSLLGKLTSLLNDKYNMVKRVRKDIAFLERELRRMQILVNTLADMEHLDDLAKDWKGSMRDLSYDMEDCIDRFMVCLGNGDANRGFMKKTARRLKQLWARHGIATQIKELKARVVEESERRQRSNLDNSVASPTRTVKIDPRLPAFHEVVKGLVAMDGRRDQVTAWVMDEGVELKVVAVVGPGGLGKTTLAMEVYRKITAHFQCRASVSVSRTLDLDKLLKDVLHQIDHKAFSKCQSEQWEKEQLIREIAQILTDKRYLIVIDDVWREQDWKIVKAAFPENYNGSRIITTTRKMNVANSCCSNSGDQLYQMEPLNDIDSRRLFFKRVFCSDNSCPPQLEDVSARILKKCGGLPLAIITIASLLANKPENICEWERLQGLIGIGSLHENDDNLKGMRDILLLSYWDLPQHLKTCLLYLCIYPEDHHIPCEELKWKWIAEGFIATQWGNLYQEAENYFNELVNRSLIQLVDAKFWYNTVQHCQIHDMVLDLIISLSDEENFAIILNGRVCNSLPDKIRRLSTQSGGQEHKKAIDAITKSKSHVRSLNVFGGTKQIPPLVDFHALRVLDFCKFDCLENKHIKNIGSLSQLRYLRLNSRRITELPEKIGNLQYLETLNLQYCASIKTLPPTMVHLQKLTRLLFGKNLVLPADVFKGLLSLEEVSNINYIDNPVKFAEQLGHLTKLRKVSISCDPALRKEDGYEGRFLEILGSSLRELGRYNLRYLGTNQMIGNYLFREPCCTFLHLPDLEIDSSMGRVPKGMASLNNIVKLKISISDIFDEEGLHILMGMPSLAHLDLSLYYLSGTRKALVVGSNGFKLVKVFSYHIFQSIGTGIAFEPGAMPALRQLRVNWRARDVMSRYCDGADMGIEHLSGLSHLQVETNCLQATVGEVEALEGSVKTAISLNPNRCNLHVYLRRYSEKRMYKDDKEREEGLQKEREARLDEAKKKGMNGAWFLAPPPRPSLSVEEHEHSANQLPLSGRDQAT